MYLKKEQVHWLGQNKSDGTKFQLTIDDVSCTKAEGTIIYVDISEELWQPCSDGTDRKGFRVKDGESCMNFMMMERR